jgi:hypothetical protein
MKPRTLVAAYVVATAVSLAFVFAAYYWRLELGDTLFALVLALTSGSTFLNASRALAVPTEGDVADLRDLKSVGEIAKLIQRAQEAAAKVAQLREEELRIENIVEARVRETYLRKLKDNLEGDLRHQLSRIGEVDAELELLQIPSHSSLTAGELARVDTILEGRRRGDFVIQVAGRVIRIPRETVAFYPFPFGDLVRLLQRRRKKSTAPAEPGSNHP